MKQIPLLQGKALLIELPEGARALEIEHYNSMRWAGYLPELSYRLDGRDLAIELPPGNWRIIGMLSEVTEESAAGMVDYFTTDEDFGKEDVFRDYKGEAFYDTALESLESAILAEGWYFENPYKSGPNINDYRNEEGGNMELFKHNLNEWREAQSRVLCRERCLLLGREGL